MEDFNRVTQSRSDINIFNLDDRIESMEDLIIAHSKDMPIYHLETLAKFYNTSIDYIVGLTNIKKPYPRVKK